MSGPSARSPVTVRLTAPPTAPAGTRLPITLTITNEVDAAVDLYLRGRTITFDVTVSDAGHSIVWRRLEGEIIPAIVQVRPLAPRERLVLRTQWDQRSNTGAPVASGDYVLRGFLLMETTNMETEPIALRIEHS